MLWISIHGAIYSLITPKVLKHRDTLDKFNRRCSGSIMKSSFFEKLLKFLREMIVLLYTFSKVVGLTCKLDKTAINCESFPVNFLEIFRTIFETPVNNCF